MAVAGSLSHITIRTEAAVGFADVIIVLAIHANLQRSLVIVGALRLPERSEYVVLLHRSVVVVCVDHPTPSRPAARSPSTTRINPSPYLR